MIQGNYDLRNFEHSVLTLLTYKYASFNKFKTLALNFSGNCSLDCLHGTSCRPLPRNFLHPPSLVCCLKNVLLSYFAFCILQQCLKDTCFVFWGAFSLQHYLWFYHIALDTHIFEDPCHCLFCGQVISSLFNSTAVLRLTAFRSGMCYFILNLKLFPDLVLKLSVVFKSLYLFPFCGLFPEGKVKT